MFKFNYKLISKIFGILLAIECVFMLLSSGVAIIYKGPDIKAFIISAVITAISASGLIYLGRDSDGQMGKREGFLVVSLVWVLFSFFGMLPFIISGSIPSITDSFFETMSGFTTTGASILNNIEELPHGILFWRSLIQWLGGMGIIVFTLAILPTFSSAGIDLFSAEVPGLTLDKIRPRIEQTAKKLWGAYLLITVVCAGFLWAGPMELYDAVCHAFTTMATGGYSTKQSSIAYWNSAYIEYVLSFFMLIAGTNFTLIYFLLSGNIKKIGKDEEFRWYICIVSVFTFLFGYFLYNYGITENFENSFRAALFQVSTIVTTTGFAGITANYVAWGPLFCVLTLFIMTSGACAGSTSGGIKIVRLIVLLKNTLNDLYLQIHPKAIVPTRVNKHVVSQTLINKALAFVFIYAIIFMISIFLLTLIGLDLTTSIGSSITCLSNVGPGLGLTGPAGNFSFVPDSGKWLLSFLMLVGRLEIFTVIILFSPSFWKK